MNRCKKGIILIVIGIVIFVFSLFVILPIKELYLVALLVLFVSIILIGVGSAIAKGFDRSLELPSEDCYYCKGTGIIEGPTGKIPCPRCGGTGISPDSDRTE